MLKRFFDSVGVSALPFPDMMLVFLAASKKERKRKEKRMFMYEGDVYRDRRELSRSLMSQWNVSLSPV